MSTHVPTPSQLLDLLGNYPDIDFDAFMPMDFGDTEALEQLELQGKLDPLPLIEVELEFRREGGPEQGLVIK